MATERNRLDSSRDLLEELEDGWATPPPPNAKLRADDPTDDKPAGAASNVVAEPSDPNVDELDEGWLDDLFPGEEEDDDDDDDEPEPELPDERLDHVAFAEAKKARDERAAKKKEKKRAKLEAKRQRQRPRAAAMRQKQKSKKGRAAGPASRKNPQAAPASATSRSEEKKKRAKAHNEEIPDSIAATSQDIDASEQDADDIAEERPKAKTKSKAVQSSAVPPRTMASIKLLAIVLAILLALAAAVAAIVK